MRHAETMIKRASAARQEARAARDRANQLGERTRARRQRFENRYPSLRSIAEAELCPTSSSFPLKRGAV
jgi:hypothetical protein